jgi:hypothetical protein
MFHEMSGSVNLCRVTRAFDSARGAATETVESVVTSPCLSGWCHQTTLKFVVWGVPTLPNLGHFGVTRKKNEITPVLVSTGTGV